MPVDSSVGGAGAESYVSITEADGFARLELGRFASKWAETPSETKEAALRRATSEIDAYVGVRPEEAYYPGRQALVFPRYTDVDIDTGTPFLPTRVKRATFLQAAYLVSVADTLDDAAQRRAKGFANYANPDGTGGQIATDPADGRLHPDVKAILGSFDEGAIVGWIRTT